MVSGALLFALLIVDICCVPVKKVSDPGASHGSSYPHAAPSFESYQGEPSDYSPGSFIPNYDPSEGASTQYYQAVPQQESSVPQSVAPPGAAFQSPPREISWVVAPLSLSGDAASSQLAETSPLLPPPGPMYQAGDLSHFEQSFEHGGSERETEEQGSLHPPPPPPPPPYMHGSESAESFTILPHPQPNIAQSWGPYPYYNYMFLMGQYPPGTYTHASSSFEQGRDHSQEDHYERYHFNNIPVPEPQTAPARTPVKAPFAKTGSPASYGGFKQQGW